MIPTSNKFKYPKLPREDNVDGKRLYLTPDGMKLPSVTTILSATKDMSGLQKWRDWVGDKEADRITKDACSIGTIMHGYLENHLLNVNTPRKKNFIHLHAAKMADIIIEKGLCDIDCVYGMEVALYQTGLWAGTADLVASHKGTICIADFKNTRKMKKEKLLEDYYCQCVAYSLCHDSMFGTKITKGVIMMVTRSDENEFIEYETIILEGKKFEKYKNMWFDRVEQYYKQNV